MGEGEGEGEEEVELLREVVGGRGGLWLWWRF